MRLFIDSSNVSQIKSLNEYFPIDGVTTNPSIIVKEQKPFLPLLKEIRNVIGEDKLLFVQTLSTRAEDIIEEARYIHDTLRGNLVVKIPVTKEGIKAIKTLSQENIHTLATTVYTPMNAYVAAKAGANYVAPYVNRIDNLTGDGIRVVYEIMAIFQKFNFSCEVLAASFKNVQQIKEVSLTGAHGVTVSPDLIEAFLSNPPIKENVEQFRNEWIQLYGEENATLLEGKRKDD
ncbi:transaldolase family protein [Salirhabdus salicampi]|uniref:transaldolase family protein n=1 Tax=Salirhabdus salicampi TaxID=476102 RepID=UPI0020C45305|nr:transaldolase family protein [Salirhabdus salicampi]MCP8615680.1 fructose-6-phosphate aldolase [Salirhabdus salicampi]